MEPDEPKPQFPPVDVSRDPVSQRLFEARTVVISGEINQDLAARVISHLTALAAASEEPITMIIISAAPAGGRHQRTRTRYRNRG